MLFHKKGDLIVSLKYFTQRNKGSKGAKSQPMFASLQTWRLCMKKYLL